MTDPVSMSSAFLSSPLAGGLATGISSALGGGRTSTRKSRVLSRIGYEHQQKYLPGIQSSIYDATSAVAEKYRNRQIQGRVADAKAAGLHPLAALGIAPGSTGGMGGGGATSMPMATESPTGSAVGEGIRAATAIARNNVDRAHQARMADLNVQEQQLRNTWLEEQIKNSRAKRLETLTNSGGRGITMDQARRDQEKLQHGLESRIRTSRDKSFATGATSPAEDWEGRYGEMGGIVGGLVNSGYDLVHNLLSQATVDQLVDLANPPLMNFQQMRDLQYPGSSRDHINVYPPSSRRRPKYPTRSRSKYVGRYRQLRK